MNRMTIGALAAATGIKVTTIRFYERAGLMPVPPRTTGRHRNYTSDHLLRLRFICRARELEFGIAEIRTLLVLAEPARPSCREVQHLAAAHLENLRHKITRLMKLEATLSHAVERCQGEPILPCPVLELLKSVR
jgi:MerR family mercuric resistance operon transcriptional regulator